LTLDGNFEVETISPSGDALFLIEHLPAVNPNHYLIRLFDLRIESLVPGALRDKSATDEVMAGLAWDGLASPNGRWLLTLYLSTLRNTAFVHTLDLSDKYPVCIDLPSGSGDFNQLKYYSLALAPSGWRLFAANAVLGLVAEISLSSRSVTRRATFQPRSFGAANASNPQSQLSRSVVSKDGSRLYFTSGLDVWVYDTASGEVDGPFLINGRISALGLSGDGKRLYVAAEKQPLLVFDTQSGLALNFPQAN
ncbi:MAG: PD40 domain-containing protein, partial [Chloroflexi bacterium]|nr:PD40 domain-containing protein [Chloroflexota bacterium]